MMMMSFSALGVVGIVYVAVGLVDVVQLAVLTPTARPAGVGKLFANPFDQFGLDGHRPGNYIFVASS